MDDDANQLDAVRVIDDLPMRQKVIAFEDMMRQFPQLDLPLKHHFGPGVYARELFIPKDTILTGKIHKYAQINMLIMGELSVLLEGGIQRIKAPFIVVSPPGTKRLAYAHEDSIWVTILGTDETDPVLIEKKFTADTEREYLEFCRTLQLEDGTRCPS